MKAHIVILAAKKFGVTEFVNPKDYDKPVQQVGFILQMIVHNLSFQSCCFSCNLYNNLLSFLLNMISHLLCALFVV